MTRNLAPATASVMRGRPWGGGLASQNGWGGWGGRGGREMGVS